MITVLGNSVLILPDRMPDQTKSNLAIPETAKSMQMNEGKVIQVGSACTEAKAGDRVIFARQNMSIMEIDGILHYIGSENQIKFIYE
jgi:co-chaperonin GroES (HSP10)